MKFFKKTVFLPKNQKKTIKLISCKSDAEADILILALKSGRIWSLYLIFCIKNHVPPNPKLLDWLIDSINSSDYIPFLIEPLDIYGINYTESITESILEFLKINNIIRVFIIKNFDSDELESRILFQILTSVTGYQIKELSLINSNIDDEALKVLNPGISHHTHLCKLDLSHNNITDNGLMELMNILPSITALVDLNLSHNLLAGKPELFEEFITALQLNLEDLKLNLGYNRIDDQCLTILDLTIFHAKEIKIVDLDLSFNRFSNEGVFKIFEAYRQGQNKGKFKLKLHPIPFHSKYLNPVFNEKKTNMNLVLERINFSDKEKKPPLSKEFLIDIKKIEKNIRMIRGKSLTIERLATICHEIYELEYEFPNKKLDELRDIIWDLLNKAIEVEDFYSITILQISAIKIGLDLYSLKASFRSIKNKTNSLTKRLIRVLNFDLPEAEINKEFDKITEEIYKYDLRGSLIDGFFSIKEKRDELIKKMIQSNYKEEIDENIDENHHDPFWFLESDLEFQNISLSQIEDLSGFSPNLYIHQNSLNYFELSQLSQEKLEKDLNSFKEKIAINKESNYFLANLCNRSLFLLADHVFKFYLNVWKFHKGDIKLNCSRIAIQYRNFGKRRELCTLLDPRPLKPIELFFSKGDFQTPDNLFSFQIDNEMTKYMHLRPLEIEKTDVSATNIAFRPHRQGLALADFGGIISELVNEKVGGNREREKMGFIRNILDYAPGPLLNSLRKTKKEGFSQDAISLYQKIQLILDNDSESQDEKLCKLIQELMQKLDGSREVYDMEKEPDALIDECYLQLYRYSNRFQETKANYNQKLGIL